MQLYYSSTSPYARKARVAIIERGLQDRVEMILAAPLEPGSEKVIPNPLGKIPVLVLDDGGVLYDSPVICQYLLANGAGPADDWDELRRHALADGVIDAAFSAVMERRRPAAQQSPEWLARWEAAIVRALDAMDREVAALGPDFGLAAIAWACALGYLDFRMASLAWRERRAGLAAWYAGAADRPSMKATVPA